LRIDQLGVVSRGQTELTFDVTLKGMKIITSAVLLTCLVITACDDKSTKSNDNKSPQVGDKKPAASKTVEVGKNVSLEVMPDGKRRVLVPAEVCMQKGPLEMFMCRKLTKEHESVVRAEIDARDLHKALLAAGAVIGSPVKFEPKFEPPKGTKIKIFVRYMKDGKETTVNAREWIRDARTEKELNVDWVFAGSFFYPGPDDDPKKPTQYAGNSGAIVCVSNFPDATLDIPVVSSDQNEELLFEAFTERIPDPLTKVTVIFDPQMEKKEKDKETPKKK
jgi:hypothetical protein